LEEILHRPGRKLHRVDGLDVVGDVRDRGPVRSTEVEHPYPGSEFHSPAKGVERRKLAPVGVPDPVAVERPLPVDTAFAGRDQHVPEPDHASTPASSIRAWALLRNSGTASPR